MFWWEAVDHYTLAARINGDLQGNGGMLTSRSGSEVAGALREDGSAGGDRGQGLSVS